MEFCLISSWMRRLLKGFTRSESASPSDSQKTKRSRHHKSRQHPPPWKQNAPAPIKIAISEKQEDRGSLPFEQREVIEFLVA